MTFDRERQTLRKYYAPTTPEGNLAKWETRTRSIDGLPARPPSAVPAAGVAAEVAA
jgi:hypothetical protein